MATPSLPQSNPNEDGSLITPSNEPRKKARRHQVQMYVETMMTRYSPKWERLSEKMRRSLEQDISRREKRLKEVQYPDYNEFAGKLLTIAWREGRLTTEQWKELQQFTYNEDEWRVAIESLYHEISGDTTFYVNNDKMVAALPWIRARLDYKPIYLKEEKKENLLLIPQVDPKPTAHSSVAPKTPTQAQPQSNDDGLLLLTLALIARLTDRLKDKEPAHTVKQETVKPEPINPEQVDADDQDRIDRIAAELLDSIEWGAI
jgi:hypothetical protein